jgi:hypothetical protein
VGQETTQTSHPLHLSISMTIAPLIFAIPIFLKTIFGFLPYTGLNRILLVYLKSKQAN